MGKDYTDRLRRAAPSSIQKGDSVVVKNFHPKSKLDYPFAPEVHKVVDRTTNNEAIIENEDGVQYKRNVAHLKRVPRIIEDETVNVNWSNRSTDVEKLNGSIDTSSTNVVNFGIGDNWAPSSVHPNSEPMIIPKRIGKRRREPVALE